MKTNVFAPVFLTFLLLGGLAKAETLRVAQAGSLRGDAEKGEIIARRWCAACHVASADQKQANADAPSFLDVARRWPNAKALAVFLAEPHGRMPPMALSQPEIADIVAYIGQLAAKDAPSRAQ